MLACLLWFPVTSEAANIEKAVISTTGADSAGVLLRLPGANRTIVIRNMAVYYDNDATAGAIYVGVIDASTARTKEVWFGTAMADNGIDSYFFGPMYQVIDGTAARAGLRFFVSAAGSDSLTGFVEYEVIND